jgi:hypothetical protein
MRGFSARQFGKSVMKKSLIIYFLILNGFFFTSCHKAATSAFKKPENGKDNGRNKSTKIAKNSFNPGNPKSSDPNAAKEKLLDPNASNSKQTKANVNGSKPRNSKSLAKPGKLKAPPKKKKNKRFMS